jgi:hypothetical protein
MPRIHIRQNGFLGRLLGGTDQTITYTKALPTPCQCESYGNAGKDDREIHHVFVYRLDAKINKQILDEAFYLLTSF